MKQKLYMIDSYDQDGHAKTKRYIVAPTFKEAVAVFLKAFKGHEPQEFSHDYSPKLAEMEVGATNPDGTNTVWCISYNETDKIGSERSRIVAHNMAAALKRFRTVHKTANAFHCTKEECHVWVAK